MGEAKEMRKCGGATGIATAQAKEWRRQVGWAAEAPGNGQLSEH